MVLRFALRAHGLGEPTETRADGINLACFREIRADGEDETGPAVTHKLSQLGDVECTLLISLCCWMQLKFPLHKLSGSQIMWVLNPGPDNPQSEVMRDVLNCAVLIQLHILKQRYVHFCLPPVGKLVN